MTELIGEHRSIERALVQVHMPRMSMQELSQILDTGLQQVGMTIEGEAKARIGKVSLGLPYVTHLLGLYSAQNAVMEGRRYVTRKDVEAAIQIGLGTMEQSTKEDYAKATRSHRADSLYEHVLLACALAKTDELGYFAPADVREPMSTVMRRRYEIPAFSRHLHDFCERQRGPVLQRIGEPRKHRFRFINPLMEPFTILHGLSRGVLTDEMLQELISEEAD